MNNNVINAVMMLLHNDMFNSLYTLKRDARESVGVKRIKGMFQDQRKREPINRGFTLSP